MGNKPGEIDWDQIIKDIESQGESLAFIWQVIEVPDGGMSPRKSRDPRAGEGWSVKEEDAVVVQGHMSRGHGPQQ